MCGIFGVFTSLKNGFTNKQVDMLGQNIIINQFRGTDSTGIFCVDHQGKSEMVKTLGGAGSLFAHPDWEAFQASISRKGKVVVGHGRAATRGTVKLENAHPFAKTFPTGEVLKLVHNGTLDYDQTLPDFHKFDVDSEWIAEMIVRYGPKDALSQIRGAMALVWWNEKEQTINFFRNAERPLHFGRFKTQYEDTFILNSEAAAVRYLSERNGLVSYKKDTPVYYFSPNTHYALKLEELFVDFEICEPIPKPKDKVVQSYIGYNVNRPAYIWDREDLYGDDLGDRNYENDVKLVSSGLIRSVEFVPIITKNHDWHRITQLENFSTMREPIKGPYNAHLRKIEKVYRDVGNTGHKPWVRVCYYDKDANRAWESLIGIDDTPADKPILVESNGNRIPGTWKDADYYKFFADVGCQKFSPGRKWRWTSNSGKEVIRHSAVVSNEGGHLLQRYKNSVDGVFIAGQQHLMEIRDLQLVKLGGVEYYRADGNRVSSAQDRCVDMCAYFFVGSEEGHLLAEVKNPADYPFIAGIVERVELATKDWHEDTGAFVLLILKDPELVADVDDTEAGTNILTGEFVNVENETAS
jgi:hypothetical protein